MGTEGGGEGAPLLCRKGDIHIQDMNSVPNTIDRQSMIETGNDACALLVDCDERPEREEVKKISVHATLANALLKREEAVLIPVSRGKGSHAISLSICGSNLIRP